MSLEGQIEKLHVQIGQVKIGRPGQSLHAILGSCIGIGILVPEREVYGLAHCLLSKAEKLSTKNSGRHVDQALHSLHRMLELEDRELRKLQTIVVGGANMTLPEDADPKRMVGNANAEFAYKTIREMGARRIHHDVGGMLGRQVTIDCTSGDFSVAVIPRLGAKQ